MQFTVPKFIEREAKIVGPLTLKQFIYIGMAGLVCFFLYLYYGQRNLFLFIVLSIIPLTIGLALAFLQINGLPLPTLIASFFRFNLSQKFYFWRRKEYKAVLIKPREELKKEEKKKEVLLKVDERSKLQEKRGQIETGRGF